MKDLIIAIASIGTFFFIFIYLPEILVKIIYKKRWLTEKHVHICDYMAMEFAMNVL